ncbi:ABC transporter permease [Agromyces mangrovi Wang et al. 2018]|uniref:ABC transporter permease n=1 Tax=Agromyces mangrovi TaxID=1858653 RepID=UPI002572CA27|nr:ABC transporter permease [Agromyces mangrovi]BDZ65220.1 sugar ABC transporter permease [Agromyces mangrovi]
MSDQNSTATAESDAPAAAENAPSLWHRLIHGPAARNFGLVIALAVLVVVGAVTAGDRFTSFDNILTIIRFASIIGVISIGMTFVITSGGIDLSVGSVMGLATVVASLSWVQAAAEQTSWLLMVLVALGVGTAAGFVNGVVIAYGKVVPFMATLAMLVGARGLAELLSNRSTQLVDVQGFLDFFRGDFLGIAWLVWIFVIAAVAGWFLLGRTTFGRRTVAVGGNFEATRLAGIRVKRHLVALYALAGFAAGVAALMMLGRTTAGTSTHGTLYELDAIAAVVVGGTLLVGGRGTIFGTVLGVLIFATLTNVFTQNNLSTSVQAVVKGVIIVVAVLLQQRFAGRSSRT